MIDEYLEKWLIKANNDITGVPRPLTWGVKRGQSESAFMLFLISYRVFLAYLII